MHLVRAVGLAVATVAGMVLATPVPVITVADGRSQFVARLEDREGYAYSYTSSVYDAPVFEQHRRIDDHLSVMSVRSTDIRAVEYFRWESEVSLMAGAYEQRAPPNEVRLLTIRVTPAYHQRLSGARWSVDLAQWFGDGVVHVSAQRLPLLDALLQGWRP